MKRSLLFIIIGSFITLQVLAQPCGDVGLSPTKAIAVCGTTVFEQKNVYNCIFQNVAKKGCPNSVVSAERSYWYKFTCFQAGTLGFTIRGKSINDDDFDWVLYDITGRDPNEVFTNSNLEVSLNIYGTLNGTPFPNSPTGCGPQGTKDENCEGNENGREPFNRMPNLILGHEYLLMIANFTSSNEGYDLEFSGGTASITDPKLPALDKARAACDGTEITIKLNKKMKCPTLTATGTEFFITPSIANVIAAEAIGCSNSFDMDSLLITLDNPLPPGDYTITIRNGSDGNTILDICDRPIPNGETIGVTIFPQFPTPMDSLTRVTKCAPDEIELVFRKRMRCNSVAPNGSDFIITGTSPVTILSAAGVNCDTVKNLSNTIRVKFTQPIQVKGSFNITLRTGTDGNTVIDECGKESLPGQSLSFSTKDTVNANFNYSILYGCKRDTINYVHDGRNEVNTWRWNFDDLRRSSIRNTSIIYATFGQKFTQLIVSNGTCSDTSAKIPIFLKEAVKAKFEAPYVVCPTEAANIINKSTGDINRYEWNFGNNTFSFVKDPLPVFYNTQKANEELLIKLVVGNGVGCTDTAMQKIIVAGICAIKVPTAFTPNGDGLNDFLYPLNAYKAKDLVFRVYNRLGEMLYETKDWRKGWNGKYKGQGADPASYVWTLTYINIDTNKMVEQKGSSILIR
jgi:gliding motility-associated-like protein